MKIIIKTLLHYIHLCQGMDDELRGLTIVVGANGFYRTLASTTPFSLVKEHFSVRIKKQKG